MRNILAAFAAATVTAATLVIANPGMATANSGGTVQIERVLSNIGQKVATAAPSVSDQNSAAVTNSVDIPWDATRGVRLTANGQTTTVTLPEAKQLDRGVRLPSGAVVYHNPNGSDQLVVPTNNGAQFLVVIKSANAPEDYAYPLATSAGQTVRVISDGSALVLGATGKPLSSIAAPWAIGKNGNVPTRFKTDGQTLVQHIAHKASSAGYPIVADPHMTWQPINFTLWYNKQEVKNMRAAGYWAAFGMVVAYACGRIRNAWFGGACTAVFGMAWWWINQTFQDAANNNQCVWITISYGADLDGWGSLQLLIGGGWVVAPLQQPSTFKIQFKSNKIKR